MSRFSLLETHIRAGLVAITLLAATLGLLALPHPAQAQWVSTGELVDSYCDSDDPEQAAFCVGYVAGALHALTAPPELMPTGRFCIDIERQPSLTAITERLIAVRKEQPDIATTPVFTVLAAIIELSFPCPEELSTMPTQPQADAPETPTDLFGLPAEE